VSCSRSLSPPPPLSLILVHSAPAKAANTPHSDPANTLYIPVHSAPPPKYTVLAPFNHLGTNETGIGGGGGQVQDRQPALRRQVQLRPFGPSPGASSSSRPGRGPSSQPAFRRPRASTAVTKSGRTQSGGGAGWRLGGRPRRMTRTRNLGCIRGGGDSDSARDEVRTSLMKPKRQKPVFAFESSAFRSPSGDSTLRRGDQVL
jgi:hypothetical protein